MRTTSICEDAAGLGLRLDALASRCYAISRAPGSHGRRDDPAALDGIVAESFGTSTYIFISIAAGIPLAANPGVPRRPIRRSPVAFQQAVKRPLGGQQNHPAGHQNCRPPAKVVNPLVKKEIGGDGVRDKCQRSRGWSYQADIRPRQAKQQAVERRRHRG
jgi:hypothetical protein